MLTKDLAQALSARLDGDGAIGIERLAHPGDAKRPSDLAVAMSGEAVAALSRCTALAVVVSGKHPVPLGSFRAVITVEEGRIALAKLTALFDPGPARSEGVHPTAIIAPDAVLGTGVSIGAYTVIGPRSRIGDGAAILTQVTVGADVAIGESCIVCGMVGISGSVTIGDRVRLAGGVGIGDHVRIGDQAVVAAGSGVGSNVPANAFVSGYPALPHQRTLENFQYLGRQKRLHGKVDEIGARLEAVERSIRNSGG